MTSPWRGFSRDNFSLGRLLKGSRRSSGRLQGVSRSLNEALGAVWEALVCFLEAPGIQSSENTLVFDGILGSPGPPGAEAICQLEAFRVVPGGYRKQDYISVGYKDRGL